MIEFYTFSWIARLLITFLLGVCILSQTLAMVLTYYRLSDVFARALETLLEIAIICEIFVFSIMYGQVINGYKNGFVVLSGYENTRSFVFILILILVILVCGFDKKLLPLSIIPGAVISLPIMESILGPAFSWFFIAALILFLARSIIISVSSLIAIKTSISALSIVQAVNSLHSGVLFSENDGYILLANHQMRKLMIAMTGKIFRNSIQFYDLLVSDPYEARYKKAELEGQMIYPLPNGTAWIFTKKDVLFRRKKYVYISATDVSKQWALTVKLQNQAQELSRKSDELKNAIANLHIFSKVQGIEKAKMRVHDILGQRLSVLLRIIQNEHCLDYDLLTSLSKGLLDELKAEQSKTGPKEDLKSIQQIFAAIGVEIKVDGQLPDNEQQACIFVDIIREGATNAVRHGLATEINIKSEKVKQAYYLTITNNGYTSPVPIATGSGIGSMRKKVCARGGNLDIIQYPLFTLSVVLPGGDLYV
ncbi:hypothetical protein JR334_07435 [Clostridia bacterium]|nr:hypothetical protein JR334_07435 [Clostridia bacterium]